jgi:hypothetical protein
MKHSNYLSIPTVLFAALFNTGFVHGMKGEDPNMHWVQRYSYCDTCVQQINEAQRVGLDMQENVYVGGYSQQVDNDMNWAVVKYSSSGTFLWEARYGGTAAALMRCMI